MPLQVKTQKTINIRFILLLILATTLLLLILYKYYEWIALNDLQSAFVKAQYADMVQDQDSQKVDKELSVLAKNVIGTNSADLKTLTAGLDQINAKIEILNGFIKADIEAQQINKNIFDKKRSNIRYIFGQRGQYLKDITENMSNYYSKRKGMSEDTLIQSIALEQVFTLWKDNAKVTAFRVKVAKNLKVEIPKNINDISDLAKYTKPDYKIREEEKIKNAYPQTYKYIVNYKKFLGGFYELMYDYVNGDTTSIGYKAASIDDLSKSLNGDISTIFEENKDVRRERIEDIIRIGIKSVSAIQGLQKDGLNKYPLVGRVNKWNEDVMMCHLYDAKIGVYKSLTKKVPEAKNVSELFIELASVTPKTTEIDESIDKSVMSFSADSEKVTLSCKDKINNKTFIFETLNQ